LNKNTDIDCLLIGHNEMSFEDYVKPIRRMSPKTGAYRDLNLNFLQYRDKPYHAAEMFNLFGGNGNHPALSMLNAFSATISYLGTYLHRRGFRFDFVHSFQDEKEELAKKLQRQSIRTAAITTTYYVSVLPILEIVDFIRKYDKTVKIVVGGPFISTQVRSQDPASLEFLFDTMGADFYVNSSQGEAALVNIINALENGDAFDGINNIYYKSDGRYIAAPVSLEDNRLSENMVDWRLFAHSVGEYANVRTAVSCPFACAFCGSPEHAGAYQTASVEDIETEMDQLDRIGSVKSIHFIEDTLNLPVSRFKEILRTKIKNNYKFTWHSYFRCQFADREMVELMKESGCEGVYLGLESGNDRILKNMNKAVTVRKYLDGIKLLKEYGILTHGNFIVGFPGETHRTVRDTVEFIKNSGIDFFRVQLWYCMPITPIWKEKEKYGIKGKSFEWSHNTMDSKTACDLIDEIFLSVEEPIWVPQYNFDINNVFHLLQRGMPLEQVKQFLRAFNDGIKEKLREPSRVEAGKEVIENIKNACRVWNE